MVSSNSGHFLVYALVTVAAAAPAVTHVPDAFVKTGTKNTRTRATVTSTTPALGVAISL